MAQHHARLERVSCTACILPAGLLLWFDQWESYLLMTRDRLIKERDKYQAAKRHARDRARRGKRK
jgi:hypothetical protein